MMRALKALERLREGNRRFVANDWSRDTLANAARRNGLSEGQEPFATILGCSDSRAPVEIVFDQGLGDLFVIRVAGNIVAPSLADSVEFAVQFTGCRLVVVLGHSGCGAIKATLEELARPPAERGHALPSIVGRVRPAIEPLMATELRHDPAALARHAVRANVRASVNQLRSASQNIERLIRDKDLLVVGAEYSLETGMVDFFEGVPTDTNP